MPESLLHWKRGSALGLSLCVWVSRNLWGCHFLYITLGRLLLLLMNTGVTSKQHKITANMVDLTKPMFSLACITIPTRL